MTMKPPKKRGGKKIEFFFSEGIAKCKIRVTLKVLRESFQPIFSNKNR